MSHMRKMYFLLLLSAVSTGCATTGGNRTPAFEPRIGDLLFQDLDSGPLCNAIEAVTEGVDGAEFSHVGMVSRAARDGIYVIEAIPKGVVETPLDGFLARSRDSHGNPKVLVGRMRPGHARLIPKAVAAAAQLRGHSYDREFDIHNEAYYCSELIHEAFRRANDGHPVFSLAPMTFIDPRHGVHLRGLDGLFRRPRRPDPGGPTRTQSRRHVARAVRRDRSRLRHTRRLAAGLHVRIPAKQVYMPAIDSLECRSSFTGYRGSGTKSRGRCPLGEKGGQLLVLRALGTRLPLLRLTALAVLSTMCAAAAPAEPITLYYWGNESDVLALDLVQDFESLHDGSDGTPPIKVIMAQSASVNKTNDPQRLLCGIVGGDPPDVVDFDRFAVGEWASRGAFTCLQPYLEGDQKERPDDPFTLHADQFYPACWNEANYGGKLYAVPTDTDNRALYYNLDLFEKHAEQLMAAGCIDPDDPAKVGPPRTWEQLRAASSILTERDEDGKLVRVGFIPNYGNSWLYIYGWLNGGKFMSDDGRTCTLNAPEIVEALAYMTELYDIMGGAEEVSAFQSSQVGADLDPFLAGKIAMRIDGDGYIHNIANLKRDLRFGVTLAPAPEGKKRLGWCGGWSLVIPDGSEHPDEAWEFIKYLVSKRAVKIKSDAQRQTSRAAGSVWIPGISARIDVTQWLMDEYLVSDPSIDDTFKEAKLAFVDAMPFSKYRPVTPVGQILWNQQVTALDRGIYMECDKSDVTRNAQLALDAGAEIVQRELDQIHDPVGYPAFQWRWVIAGYIAALVTVVAFGYWYFNQRMHATGYFRREFYAGYLFASPWFFGFIVFSGGPIVFSLFMSFCQYDVFHDPKWVGFKNYVDMFCNDPLFYKSLWNTVYMAIGIPLGMAVGLGIAMLLSYEIKAWPYTGHSSTCRPSCPSSPRRFSGCGSSTPKKAY